MSIDAPASGIRLISTAAPTRTKRNISAHTHILFSLPDNLFEASGQNFCIAVPENITAIREEKVTADTAERESSADDSRNEVLSHIISFTVSLIWNFVKSFDSSYPVIIPAAVPRIMDT